MTRTYLSIISAALLAVSLPLNAAPPPEMDRYARQLGSLCGLDMREEKAVRQVQQQPAFFWVIAEAMRTTDGISPRDFNAILPALSCNKGKNILINAVLAEKILAETRLAQAQPKKGKGQS